MIKAFFAGIFVLIFNICFFVSFILFVLLNTLLSVDFYKGPVSSKLYETTIEIASSAIYQQKDDIKIDFTKEEIVNIFKETVTKQDFQDTLVSFLRQVLEPDFGDDGVAVITLDLSKISSRLPDFAELFATKLIATIPDCGGDLDPEKGDICVPEGMSHEAFKSQVMLSLDVDFLSSIPSEVKVFTLREKDLYIYEGRRLDKSLLWDLWLMTLAVNALLMLIIALIILRPFHRVLKWISKPLISGSFFAGLLFFGLYNFNELSSKMLEFGSSGGGEVIPGEFNPMIGFVGDVLKMISVRALWLSGSILLVGISIYLAGVLIKRNSNE